MKIIKLFAVIIIYYSVGFAQSAFDEQFKLVEKLYSQENYFDAITEAKRLLYFEKSGKYNFDTYNLIAQSYKQGAKYSDAISYFTLAEINSHNTDELYQSKIEIIRVNILRKTTNRAISLLDSLQNDERFANRNAEIIYWRGWAYIFADDWEKASKEFSKIDSSSELSRVTGKTADDMYSVSFAKTISYFIPGAGQIYTGEYISGVLSLGWNLLWGFLTVNALIDERIFDGFVIANFLWLRFYRGNLQNAENFTLEKNIEISNKSLHYLQYKFNGLKP